jgi:hypothetical protein
MPTAKKQNEDYGAKEAKRRFEAALQGAFNTPATPLKSMTPKRPKAQPSRAKKKPGK